MTDTELLEAARKKEIRDLAAVDLAVLENDGSISFFQSQDPARGWARLRHWAGEHR